MYLVYNLLFLFFYLTQSITSLDKTDKLIK
jgi:hypothetical protein